MVVKIGWMGEIDNLNPLIGWTNNVYEIYGNEYLLMVARDWDTFKPTDDGIAKSWELSDDQLVWTFHMNEGLTWQDGEEVTAEDAAFTYNFIIENQIANFITFLTGVDHAEVVDKYTYKVICKTPVANMLTLWIACLPKHVFGEMSAKEATVKFQNDPPCIGSGPWQVVEWKRDNYLRMAGLRRLLPRSPQARRGHVRRLPERRHDGPGLPERQPRRHLPVPARAVRQAQGHRGRRDARVQLLELGLRGLQLLRRAVRRSPCASRSGVPQRTRVCHRPPEDPRQRVQRSWHTGVHVPAAETWSDPDYAWAPSGDEMRGYDPDTANQILDDAGYTDSNGDGVREYKGKPIKLASVGRPGDARGGDGPAS